MMATREETYRRFGPLLTEAVTLVLLEEVNHLRANQGMPELTEQYILERLNNHLGELQPYNWMLERSQ